MWASSRPCAIAYPIAGGGARAGAPDGSAGDGRMLAAAMNAPLNHVARCLVAGLVALLPIVGAVLGIVWLEGALSASWRAQVDWYVPGLGMLLAAAAIYAVGLAVTTFVGRWLWRVADRGLERLPLLGSLYQSLKEVLGYDSGRERFFQAVVTVACDGGEQIGFVTGEFDGADGSRRLTVFVPGSPNPTSGRLLLVPPTAVHRLDARPADALRTLVAMGKSPLRP
jgi:uncharacterized membrane protein